jgi:hypothetical protein
MMDCPNIADLKDKSRRPAFMRKTDFLPCACKKCFFCKNGFTRGVAHKQPPGMPRFRVRVDPPSPEKPPAKPDKHSRKRINVKKDTDWCKVCTKSEQEAHPELTQNALRDSGRIKRTRQGCLECCSGRGVPICKDCWPEYSHDM